MAANTSQIFPLSGDVQWPGSAAVLTTANTAKDGTGTVLTVCTAPTDGLYVEKLRFVPLGTNVATVARVFVNNGSATSTAANNSLFAELSLPATTLTETAEMGTKELTLRLALPATYKLTAVIGTTVAAGWAVTAVNGKYS